MAHEPQAADGVHTLMLFLGSTLGNLHPPRPGSSGRRPAVLRPGGAFLLGVDLKKSEEILIPAYDDPLGVTAAFNLNHLARINRELGGEFDVLRFRHRARYDREHGRIEIHIVSPASQVVTIRALTSTSPLPPVRPS